MSSSQEQSALHASGKFYLRQASIDCLCCHTCGSPLDKHFCEFCGKTRHYLCHGYEGDQHDSTPCFLSNEKAVALNYIRSTGRSNPLQTIESLLETLEQKEQIINGLLDRMPHSEDPNSRNDTLREVISSIKQKPIEERVGR